MLKNRHELTGAESLDHPEGDAQTVDEDDVCDVERKRHTTESREHLREVYYSSHPRARIGRPGGVMGDGKEDRDG